MNGKYTQNVDYVLKPLQVALDIVQCIESDRNIISDQHYLKHDILRSSKFIPSQVVDCPVYLISLKNSF